MRSLTQVTLQAVFTLLFIFIINYPTAAQQHLSDSDPVAVFGDEKITLNELKDAAKAVNARGYIGLSSEERKNLLDTLVAKRLFAKEGRKRNLHEAAEVRKEIDTAINEILMKHLLKLEIQTKMEITDSDIEKFYENNKHLFSSPEIAEIEYFKIAKTADNIEISDLESYVAALNAHTGADKSLADIKKQIAPQFQKLDSLSGEILEIPLPKGKYYKNTSFDEVIFNLKEKQAGFVEAGGQIWIVRLIKKKGSAPIPLKDIADDVRRKLLHETWTRLYTNFSEDLKRQYGVVIFYDNLR